MSDNNIEIKKEDRLLKVFALVNEWLKFAEAKNAMLIAFNGASIYGLAKALELQFFQEHDGWVIYATVSMIILSFSVVVGLLSFIPQLNFINFSKSNIDGRTSNIYFGHLKNKSELQIIQGLCETNEEKFNSYELDIAHQIQQNSIIASNKYDFFSVAVWITIIGYVNVLAFILAIMLWVNRNQEVK